MFSDKEFHQVRIRIFSVLALVEDSWISFGPWILRRFLLLEHKAYLGRIQGEFCQVISKVQIVVPMWEMAALEGGLHVIASLLSSLPSTNSALPRCSPRSPRIGTQNWQPYHPLIVASTHWIAATLCLNCWDVTVFNVGLSSISLPSTHSPTLHSMHHHKWWGLLGAGAEEKEF